MKFNQFFKSLNALLISSKIINCSYGDYDQLLAYYLKDKEVNYDFLSHLPKHDDLWKDLSRISPKALTYLLDYVDCHHQDKKGQSIAFLALQKGIDTKIDIVLDQHIPNTDEYNMIMTHVFHHKSHAHLNILNKVIAHSKFEMNDDFATVLIQSVLDNSSTFEDNFKLFELILQNEKINQKDFIIIQKQLESYQARYNKHSLHFYGQNKSLLEQTNQLSICLENKILNFSIKEKTLTKNQKRIKI